MRRRITWGAQLRILLHARGIGFAVQIAWLILLGGAATFLFHVHHWHLDATAIGHVDRFEYVKRGEDADPRWRVYATFTDSSGVERHMSSYTDTPRNGDVNIRYDAAEPSHAVIEHGDPEATPEPEQRCMSAVLVAVGGLLAGLSLLRGWWKLRLLRGGSIAEGRYVSERLGRATRFGQERVLMYEFDVPEHGTQRTEAYWIGPRPEQPTATIFYNPARPSRAVVLQYQPGHPELLSDGTIVTRGGGEGAAVLPPIAIVACIAALVRLASFYV